MVFKKVSYSYIDLPRITKRVADRILDALEKGLNSVETTLDLGLSREFVRFHGDYIVFRDNIVHKDLLVGVKEDRVYEVVGNVFREVVIRASSIYKLKPVAIDQAPTLEINGIHMHRITGITPWIDSMLKVRKARVGKGHYVLDTCMGLGYTAIHSILHGASRVVTVEVDPYVIEITRHNPWSRMLSSENIEIAHESIVDVITVFDSNSFHRIIHDPPRFTGRTGDLYSAELYREFYRVLKPGGILYHYTGEPGRHSGRRVVKGIGERLRKTGFIVRYDKTTQGYIAYKPRTF